MKNRTIFSLFIAIASAVLCTIFIIDSENIISACEKSVNTCLSVIIPSLFAFMVLSQVMVSTGAADILFYPIYKISSIWFKGDRKLFSIFMLSLIGGYPVGIKLLKEYIAYNPNYSAIAEKMLCFCYCGSPAFIIQIAGLTVFNSSQAGLLVYLSNICACIVIAFILNISEKNKISSKSSKINVKITLNDITSSINSSVKALGIICGTIVAFNIFLEVINFSGITNILNILQLDKLFFATFEISNISLYKGSNFDLLPLFAAITSFGGICIIVQTAALSEGKIKLKKFILSRVPAALLSSIFCYFFVSFSGITVQSSVTTENVPSLSSVNPICSLCIILMTYIIIKNYGNVTDKSKNK